MALKVEEDSLRAELPVYIRSLSGNGYGTRDRCHFLEAACRVANQAVGATGRLCRVTRAVGVRDYRCVSPCRITPLD